MKNFYELSTKDKDKYREEFNKLKFTKDINVGRGSSLFLVIAGMIVSGFLSVIAEEEGIDLKGLIDIIDMVWMLSLGIFVILEIYCNITFKRWMKIKHNVEY